MGTAYNTNVVTDGLRGCWDAGNRKSYPTTGTTWYDVVGGANGTLMNEDDDALNFNSFKGGYFELDGTDGRVDCGDNLICTWSEVSICLWASATDISSGSMGMVSRGHGVVFEFSMSMDTAQKCLSCLVDGGWLLSDAGSLNSYFGKWTHYAMRWITGTDNFRLYINGEVVKTGTQSIVNIGSSGKQNLCIGDRGLVNNKEFNGDIGPVYIYDRALSDAEIKQNYEATKFRFEPRIPKEGLMGYWDAGDPQCFDGSMVNQYAAGTWNLIDLCSGTVGEFDNGNPLPNFSLDNGGYWTFDGTDDGIWAGKGVADSMYEQYSNANGITGIMWMNLASDGLNVFFWKDDMFQFRYDSSSKLNMRSGNASSWSTSADLKSAADLLTTDGSEWACVVALANKSNDAREIWLNGERVANDTGSGMVWGTDNATMGVAGGWGSDTLDGKVGMALLYSRALSAAEIKDFYNKTKARFGH